MPALLLVHLTSSPLPACFLLSLGALGSVAAAPAPKESAPALASAFELGTLTVYGETPRPAERMPMHVEAATLELLEKEDLAGALALLPGITLTRFGGRNETAVNVRGYSRAQTPLFIDGVPVYAPYDGIVDLSRFTTYDVASISVAKGYSSALLGPNTMGGAITIITRQPTRLLEGQVSGGLLSGEGYHGSLNLGSRRKQWYFQAGASYVTQDDYPLSDKFTPGPFEDGGDRANAYRTDWKLSGKVAYTPNSTDEYALGILRQDGKKGTPPPTTMARYWQWPQWDKQTLYYVSSTRLGETAYLRPRLYYDTYDNTLSIFDDARYATQARASSTTAVSNDYTYGGSLEIGGKQGTRNTLKGIVHYKFDHHREYPDITRRPTTSYVMEDAGFSYGLEDTLRLAPRWELQLGLSYDTRETRKSVDPTTGARFPARDFSSFNPEAGLFYELGEASALHATVARKSRFPSMKERYTYRMGQGIPNPGLDAEKALHYELGYVGRLAPTLTLNASVYLSRVESTLQSVFLSPTSNISQFQNIGTSENRGLDLGVEWIAHARARFGATYGYVKQKTFTILPKNTEPVKVTDSPPHSGSLHADIRPFKSLSVIPSLEYSSWRYSVADGRGTNRKVGGFTLASLKLSVRLPHHLTLSAGAKNLFDKNYVLQEGYPEPGRTLFANARYDF